MKKYILMSLAAVIVIGGLTVVSFAKKGNHDNYDFSTPHIPNSKKLTQLYKMKEIQPENKAIDLAIAKELYGIKAIHPTNTSSHGKKSKHGKS